VRTTKTFPRDAKSSHDARLWATPFLLAAGMDGSSPDALVVLTELVTNAITHGTGQVTVNLERGQHRVRIEVTDTGRGEPRVLGADPEASGGRGLLIVEKLATTWGFERDASAKTVWADVAF
jgi:anti-sigma regulatory factor (Ser/Thr protein kinase)